MSVLTKTPLQGAQSLFARDGIMPMLALDQRGSLRSILANGRSEDSISDADLRSFKAHVTALLSKYASAVLLDRDFGEDAMKARAEGTALILACDRFTQSPGQLVMDAELDPDVTVDYIQKVGADALKFLCVWREKADHSEEMAKVRAVVDLAKRAGVKSLIEIIVRTPDGTSYTDLDKHAEAVYQTAVQVADFGHDIYKAEVPGYGKAGTALVEKYAARLSSAIPMPWVVLSSGVDALAFPSMVKAAAANGASGFLAGRAIWAESARDAEPYEHIKKNGVTNFEALAASAKAGLSARQSQ